MLHAEAPSCLNKLEGAFTLDAILRTDYTNTELVAL